MADLFSTEWSQGFMQIWNDDEEIISSLQRAGFNSVVAYGMPDTEEPAFVMTIQDGLVSSVNSAALDDGESAVVRAYIAMSTVDGDLVPWVASQSDLLAEDWIVVQ